MIHLDDDDLESERVAAKELRLAQDADWAYCDKSSGFPFSSFRFPFSTMAVFAPREESKDL